MLQILFAAVLTVAILLQGLTGIAKHLPQIEPEIVFQIKAHGHSHDPVTDTIWSGHGHSHDVADHDHNPMLALIGEDPLSSYPRTKATRAILSFAAWNMNTGPERPPRA
ncbi:hypothetical protein [Tropicibacter sp. Alg240-R139]|uniref:hypothetical protein n=1 Tax=Tropicibacter sp. Alg240-R139 TaxID=2305991 RepID=UPI0019675000|nr:hypothetical protein [Tropicibacter sp. Alg240-R139]